MTKLKLLSWNVNSLRIRGDQLPALLAAHNPDVLALQEIKQPAAQVNSDSWGTAAHYERHLFGQPGYNGVGLLAKEALREVQENLPHFPDHQARLLAATIGDVRVVCVYVPNGQALNSDKYTYKLRWLEALHGYLATELKRFPRLVVLGDFNIVPRADDQAGGDRGERLLASTPERAALQRLLALGLRDAFRVHHPYERPFCWGDYGAMNQSAEDYRAHWPPLAARSTQPSGAYSWWDYRLNAFGNNFGLRIDLTLVSSALNIVAAGIDVVPRSWPRPSDHCPVWVIVE